MEENVYDLYEFDEKVGFMIFRNLGKVLLELCTRESLRMVLKIGGP